MNIGSGMAARGGTLGGVHAAAEYHPRAALAGEHRHLVGTGHIYHGRYKSFPAQTDEHFLTVCRYVERNPLRASLVKQADARPWSSLSRRRYGVAQTRELLSDWPVDRPARVNAAETAEEFDRLRRSVASRLGIRPGRSARSPAWAWHPPSAPVADRGSNPMTRHHRTRPVFAFSPVFPPLYPPPDAAPTPPRHDPIRAGGLRGDVGRAALCSAGARDVRYAGPFRRPSPPKAGS